ncbi:hypothetical protein B0H10DRAFT_1754209, partial [Mycena sp. CBHHK59/15]
REQELLNEITVLRYENVLPECVQGTYRNQLLRSYQTLKGLGYDLVDLHPALNWRRGDIAKIPEDVVHGAWRLVSTDKFKVKDKEPKAASKKRTSTSTSKSPQKKRSTVVAPPAPCATRWDRVNYSCGFDALFAPLYDIWQSHAPKWTDRFSAQNICLRGLASGF